MNDENIVERAGFSLFQYELFFFVFRAYIRLLGVLGRAFFDSNRMLNGFERRKKKQHRLNRREATMKIMMKERLGGTCA